MCGLNSQINADSSVVRSPLIQVQSDGYQSATNVKINVYMEKFICAICIGGRRNNKHCFYQLKILSCIKRSRNRVFIHLLNVATKEEKIETNWFFFYSYFWASIACTLHNIATKPYKCIWCKAFQSASSRLVRISSVYTLTETDTNTGQTVEPPISDQLYIISQPMLPSYDFFKTISMSMFTHMLTCCIQNKCDLITIIM